MKKKTWQTLVKDLDKEFSINVRLKASNNGIARCVTCGIAKEWKKLQAGHYHSRSHFNLRWSHSNVFPQCVSCNVFKSGNYPSFTEYLILKFGTRFLKTLMRNANKIRKYSTKELEELITLYSEENKKLLKTNSI